MKEKEWTNTKGDKYIVTYNNSGSVIGMVPVIVEPENKPVRKKK